MLEEGIEEILSKYGKEIVDEIRSNMAKKKLNNTGETSRSIRYEIKDSTLIIYAEEHILALNDGAKAIKKKTTGTFIQEITKWAQSKLNLSYEEARGLAFGYLANRTGKGNPGGGFTTNAQGDYIVPNKFNSGGVLSDTLNSRLIINIRTDVAKGFEDMIVEGFTTFVKDGINSK